MAAQPDKEPVPDKPDDRTPFQRFEDLTRRLITVPKSEIDEKRRPKS
jgi:hypothetical protein